MRIHPVTFVWRALDLQDEDGVLRHVRAMVPLPQYGNLCGRQFAEGEEYTLTPLEERSMASHRQYFAALNSGFKNIPERIRWRVDKKGKPILDDAGNKIPSWPTVEHWRKWLLIETNCYSERIIEEASPAHARRLAAWLRVDEDFARIAVNRSTVIIRRAKSQAMPAMKKSDFEASKRAVLELNDAMTDVPPGTHWREGGMDA